MSVSFYNKQYSSHLTKHLVSKFRSKNLASQIRLAVVEKNRNIGINMKTSQQVATFVF